MERSRYLGVYTNKYKPTCEEYPYRVAIKQYINGISRYKNIGFFKTEETSANIYNIYALNTFGRGAVINDVELGEETNKEMDLYFKSVVRADELLNKAVRILKEHSDVIKVYNKV